MNKPKILNIILILSFVIYLTPVRSEADPSSGSVEFTCRLEKKHQMIKNIGQDMRAFMDVCNNILMITAQNGPAPERSKDKDLAATMAFQNRHEEKLGMFVKDSLGSIKSMSGSLSSPAPYMLQPRSHFGPEDLKEEIKNIKKRSLQKGRN